MRHYLQSMIYSRMNIDVATIITRLPGFLILLPPHILLMIRQRHIEIKRLIPLGKP